jgi:hypothetical protein
MLRFDLSNEDVGDDFVGALLVFSNTILPRGALAVGILWDAAQAVIEIKGELGPGAVEREFEFDNPTHESGDAEL